MDLEKRAEREGNGMITVKKFELETTKEEMEMTAHVLAALSEALPDLLIAAAHDMGEDETEAAEAGEEARRALMIGAAACQITAAAMQKKEAASCQN